MRHVKGREEKRREEKRREEKKRKEKRRETYLKLSGIVKKLIVQNTPPVFETFINSS